MTTMQVPHMITVQIRHKTTIVVMSPITPPIMGAITVRATMVDPAGMQMPAICSEPVIPSSRAVQAADQFLRCSLCSEPSRKVT